jgi:Flp pilus assembly protein TadG
MMMMMMMMTDRTRPLGRISQWRRRQARRGKVLLILVIGLPLLLLLASFALQVAQLEHGRLELGTVVDAAAYAAGDTYNATGDIDAARTAAQSVAHENLVMGSPLEIDDADIEFGRYSKTGDEWEFHPTETRPNAVRVTGRVEGDTIQSGAVFLSMSQLREVQIRRSRIWTQVDRDIAVALDRSSAMAYEEDALTPEGPIADFPPPPNAPPRWNWCMPAPADSKWRQMVLSVDEFLLELDVTGQQEQVALVTFASEGTAGGEGGGGLLGLLAAIVNALLDVVLTLDYDQVRNSLDSHTRTYCGGGSDLAAGLEKAVEALTDPAHARPDAEKVIIVVAGAREHPDDPVHEAQLAAAQGITVHAVTYGRDANQALLRQVAAAGGGTYQHADTPLQLTQILRDLAARVPNVIVPGN